MLSEGDFMHAHPLEARLAHVAGAFHHANERLNSLDRRLDGVDRRLDSFEHVMALRFDQVDRKFTWLTGMVLGTWITTMLAVLLHH
jgi:tetrahydromethanopterin S-methyltransferase subunit G